MDISVIIPLYNSENTIRECLLSLLNSNFDRDFEIIVVDDGSVDESVNNIKDLNARIITQANKGAAAARNTGAKNAKSDLLVFVDSDVIFYNNVLKGIYEHLKKDDVDYVTIRHSIRPANNKLIHKYKALADYCYLYDDVYTSDQKKQPVRQVTMQGGTEAYKKEVFEKLGRYDELIKGADIEREKLFSNLFHNYNMLADGNLLTKHYFPDFKVLVKNYFFRVFNTMDLMIEHKYTQPYFERNRFRTALGGLTTFSLILSFLLFMIFNTPYPLYASIAIFTYYFLSHSNMFIIALKEYGVLFLLYALITNLFFTSLISLAGFLGILRNKLRK